MKSNVNEVIRFIKVAPKYKNEINLRMPDSKQNLKYDTNNNLNEQ